MPGSRRRCSPTCAGCACRCRRKIQLLNLPSRTLLIAAVQRRVEYLALGRGVDFHAAPQQVADPELGAGFLPDILDVVSHLEAVNLDPLELLYDGDAGVVSEGTGEEFNLLIAPPEVLEDFADHLVQRIVQALRHQ